jgi:sigma-E factor negative regulatory protein RseC
MTERGVVTAVEDGEATVSFEPSERCVSCRRCAGANDGKRMVMRVRTRKNVRPGDMVTIEVNPRALLSSAFLVFVLPLFMFIIGVLASVPLLERTGIEMDKNLAGILAGLILMTVTFVFVFLFERRSSHVSALSPRIVAIEKEASLPTAADNTTSEDDND